MTNAALALNDLEISNELVQDSMAELVGGIRHNTGTRVRGTHREDSGRVRTRLHRAAPSR